MKIDMSLVEIVDRLNEIEQLGEFLCLAQKEEAKQILLRYYIGSPIYLGFSIPQLDFDRGGQLFTGERLYTRMGIHTVLGLEACRSILSLVGYETDSKIMLDEIDMRLKSKCYVKDYCVTGECAYAALAFWRYLLVSNWPDKEERLQNYLRILKENRDGIGGWKHFPFYYTLFVLQETQLPDAREELIYAWPAAYGRLPNLAIGEPFRSRRKMVLEYCISFMHNEIPSYWPLGI